MESEKKDCDTFDCITEEISCKDCPVNQEFKKTMGISIEDLHR